MTRTTFTNTTSQFVSRLFLAAARILFLITTAWIVLRFIRATAGGRSGWAPILDHGYLLALFPGLIIAAIGRKKWLALLTLLLILLLGGSYWPTLLPPQALARSGEGELKVMTFNVNFRNRNAEGIAGLIGDEQPDLVAFQEMTPELMNLLLPKLSESHPHYLVDYTWGTTLLLISRYPLTPQPKSPPSIRVQPALVETPNGPVAIWNVHPAPAIISNWEAQRDLLSLVAGKVTVEKNPVIVLGDFNTTTLTDNYRLIADHLVDVQRTAGRGFGFTFPDLEKARSASQSWPVDLLLSSGPVVKIDHIFVSHHFAPSETYVLPEAYHSDHRPVVATLGIAW